MDKLKIFAPLANAYLNSAKAPKSIQFTDAETLRVSVEGLAALAGVEYYSLVDEENVYKHVDDYERMLKDRLNYGNHLKPFDNLANVFANKLHDGIVSLKLIKHTVTDLSKRVLAGYEDYIANDPVMSAYTGSTALPRERMPVVNWQLLDQVSERGTIMRIHHRIGYSDDAPINASVIALAMQHLPGVADHREAEPVELKPEKVAKIVDNVYSAVKGQGCTKQEVQDAVRASIFLTNPHLRHAANAITALAELRDGSSINQMMQLIHLNQLILPHITDEVTDVSAAARKKINHNLDLIREITEAAAYVAFYLRNEVWKDALLVPGPMVNRDNIEAFQAQGGTPGALTQYYNYAFKETGIPATGLSLKFTLESLGQATSEYQLEAARQTAACVAKKQDYMRSAFINVGLEYLNQHRDQFAPEFHTSDLVAYVGATYDSVLPDTPLENRFYELLLNSCYINRIERNLYHRLSRAYLAQAQSTEMLTDEQCNHIDVKVYADMVAEYLVENGIVTAQF